MNLQTATGIVLIWLMTIMILELNVPYIMLSVGIAMLTAYHFTNLAYMHNLEDARDNAVREAKRMRRIARLTQGNILESSHCSSIQVCAARSLKYITLVQKKNGAKVTIHTSYDQTRPVVMTVCGTPTTQP
jgi:hypothetical protein